MVVPYELNELYLLGTIREFLRIFKRERILRFYFLQNEPSKSRMISYPSIIADIIVEP